jgi:hypothetical protein
LPDAAPSGLLDDDRRQLSERSPESVLAERGTIFYAGIRDIWKNEPTSLSIEIYQGRTVWAVL